VDYERGCRIMGTLATTLTYDFTLDNGERIKGGSLRTEINPERDQPEFPGSDIQCDLENVDSIVLSDDRTVQVFWAQDVFGPDGDPLLLMEDQPRDLGLIVTCEGQTWILRSEPTLDDRIGLNISNERGKTLFTGVGDLVEIAEPRIHQLIASFDAVYRWRRSSPKACAHCHGAVRKGGGGPDYSAPDGGI
jgi:hypothetical protein